MTHSYCARITRNVSTKNVCRIAGWKEGTHSTLSVPPPKQREVNSDLRVSR